ncbi:MAG: aminopeptidase P family N-terminal domain-containing protein [Sphingobacterium sp.]|nr:aminopeptidase P family N-terminal domain-containing protein [Sphingobacterium sp.]
MTGIEPLTAEDYAARQEKARRLLLRRTSLDAVFIGGGTNLLYFTKVGWWLSERVFGVVLSPKKDPVWVCPAFEAPRAKELVPAGQEIRTWEEHESPYALIGGVLKDIGAATGRLGTGARPPGLRGPRPAPDARRGPGRRRGARHRGLPRDQDGQGDRLPGPGQPDHQAGLPRGLQVHPRRHGDARPGRGHRRGDAEAGRDGRRRAAVRSRTRPFRTAPRCRGRFRPGDAGDRRRRLLGRGLPLGHHPDGRLRPAQRQAAPGLGRRPQGPGRRAQGGPARRDLRIGRRRGPQGRRRRGIRAGLQALRPPPRPRHRHGRPRVPVSRQREHAQARAGHDLQQRARHLHLRRIRHPHRGLHGRHGDRGPAPRGPGGGVDRGADRPGMRTGAQPAARILRSFSA